MKLESLFLGPQKKLGDAILEFHVAANANFPPSVLAKGLARAYAWYDTSVFFLYGYERLLDPSSEEDIIVSGYKIAPKNIFTYNSYKTILSRPSSAKYFDKELEESVRMLEKASLEVAIKKANEDRYKALNNGFRKIYKSLREIKPLHSIFNFSLAKEEFKLKSAENASLLNLEALISKFFSQLEDKIKNLESYERKLYETGFINKSQLKSLLDLKSEFINKDVIKEDTSKYSSSFTPLYTDQILREFLAKMTINGFSNGFLFDVSRRINLAADEVNSYLISSYASLIDFVSKQRIYSI